MKTKYIFISISLLFIILSSIVFTEKSSSRFIHASFIDNNVFKKNYLLSHDERILNALPPNKYFEQENILELNPQTGETESYKIFQLQEQLNGYNNRSVPGSNGYNWVERGPNNVPGRTRAMMYDPNDTTHKRVFAGGVSGGLWVNNNIESSSSVWQRVGIPENLAISSITFDINDTNTFYVGTGELYVSGSAANVFIPGNGIWKSTDAGNSWSHVFGGANGETYSVSSAELIVNSPSSITGTYSAVKTTNFGNVLTSITGDLVLVDDGTSSPSEGCSTLINSASMNGKIAVIDRGTCTFVNKVKMAQNAGAIAAIIINSVPTFPFNMAGTDPSITIPSVMIGQSDGLVIKNAMTNSNQNVTLNSVDNLFPSGVVLVPGKFYINDLITRNNGGVTEIYAAVSSARHFNEALGDDIGIFKSIDGGNSWIKLNLPVNVNGDPYAPNDLLLTSDNKIWVSTINSYLYGDGGGTILSSDDGINFVKKFESNGDLRTQIAASSTDPNLIYVLMRGSTATAPVKIFKTTDGFVTTPNSLTLPNDPDAPANDFTRGQSFYDLAIAVDPNNDQNVMVGGINTFKSSNGGISWSKTSKSSSFGAGSVSTIHADVHNFVFNPSNSSKGLIGTDGGVYYVSNWDNAQSSSNVMFSRGNGYNTTQFYKGAISQRMNALGILGGAQDNGSNFISNANITMSSSRVSDGDGMFCFIDKNNQYMITSYVNNTYTKHDSNGNVIYNISNNQNEGFFVNPSDLDDNLDILYSDAHTFSNSTINGKITRFTLGNSSATRDELTNTLLTRPVTALKVSPYTTSSTTLFVGTDVGQLYKVTLANYFPTWTDLTPEPFDASFSGSISSINFGANEDEIMVTFHNYGVVNVYYSEDGGITWQNKEGDLPDLPVKDILMNPLLNDEVIIATDLGVWKTINFKDANPHWERSQNGMQNVKVTSFDLRTLDNTVLASTYGRGLFTGQFTANSTAAINDVANSNVINVYPTLSNGNLKITSSKNLNNSKLQVFDVNGKKVFNKSLTINSNESQISLNVDKGIYFVDISNGNIHESHKIIIK